MSRIDLVLFGIENGKTAEGYDLLLMGTDTEGEYYSIVKDDKGEYLFCSTAIKDNMPAIEKVYDKYGTLEELFNLFKEKHIMSGSWAPEVDEQLDSVRWWATDPEVYEEALEDMEACEDPLLFGCSYDEARELIEQLY